MEAEDFLSRDWEVAFVDGDEIHLYAPDGGVKGVTISWKDVFGLLVKLHYQGYGDDIPELLDGTLDVPRCCGGSCHGGCDE